MMDGGGDMKSEQAADEIVVSASDGVDMPADG